MIGLSAGSAAAGASTRATASVPSVLTTPTQIAHTADGAVGYRELGKGSPIVLITGFGATMDEWTPALVDGLAAHHRVVLLDNAGIGDTASPPGTLTISAMAQQTSALITSLELGRTAVLGWSMGGLIAQALAVQDPKQVSKLVLAATQAGNGHALPVPPAAAALINSANPLTVVSVLFPADHKASARAYVAAILQYTHFYQSSATVKEAQNFAIAAWFGGMVAEGREVGRLRLPTLVADGEKDRLDPVANDHQLANLIKGAQLVLYPDAGHGFLFQDTTTFVQRVDTLLR
ncbi:MAG TPA: alpha/beta hydrolase [Acidimicrobiales bacterium]